MQTLITGASSGLGRALALELASEGHRLFLVGRNASRLDDLVQEIHRDFQHVDVVTEITDLSVPEQCRQLAVRIAKETIRLDFLVHCAGAGEPAADFASLDFRDFQEAMAVNVSAPMLLTQSLLPLLTGHEPASRIVMVGAGMDKRVQPGTGSYGISKMALFRLMLQLSVEFDSIKRGLVISLFQPGLVDTPGIHDHVEKAKILGLPHAQWLKDRLKNANCLTAEQAASALAFTLLQVPESDFHGSVFHAPELVDSLFFTGS